MICQTLVTWTNGICEQKINVNPELKGTVFGENIIDQAWGPYWKNIGHLDRTDRAQRQFLLHRKDQRPMFSISAPSKLGYRTLKTWLRFKKFRPLLTQGLLLFQNRYPLEGDNKFALRAHDSFTPAVYVWKSLRWFWAFLFPFPSIQHVNKQSIMCCHQQEWLRRSRDKQAIAYTWSTFFRFVAESHGVYQTQAIIAAPFTRFFAKRINTLQHKQCP